MAATSAAASEEMFEIFDSNMKYLGLERRSVGSYWSANFARIGSGRHRSQKLLLVHQKGYYHRSVNVFVFNSAGQLLLQRRAAIKDICPNLWDLSCAEHVQPQEPYIEGAARGLKEELGTRSLHPFHSYTVPLEALTDARLPFSSR